MDNPFQILVQRLEKLEEQNQQLLDCLQRLEAKESEDQFLSIDETRKMWVPAVSRSTIYAWEAQGHLKRYLISGKPCFLKSEVMAACKGIGRYKKRR